MNPHGMPTGLILLVLALITACAGGSTKIPDSTTATPTRTAAATHVEAQSQPLMLRLTSPRINMITELDQITVAGVTSPDATLSVNGHLIAPDSEGSFSVNLGLPHPSVPMAVEIISSSITGETKSEIRPVVSSDGSIQSGLFGTVRSVSPSEITLNTESNVISLSVNSGTSIAIHGWESPSVLDITTGTLVGVIKEGAQAKSILAVPTRPVLTRHFTGIVTDSKSSGPSGKAKITLLDSSQRQITANTTDEIADGTIGSLVTAVLEQDLSSGDLNVTAIDPALTSAGRIVRALAMNQRIDSHQAKENVTALSWRLAEHGVRNVSMLLDQQSYEGWMDSVTSAKKTYAMPFSKYDIGSLSADVTGLITSIATSLGDSSTKLITVQPALGQPVTVRLSEDTPIVLFGDRIKSGQLDLASRITARYSIKENIANRVTVLAGNTLSLESSAQLAAVAAQGEVQGLLVDVIEPELVVSILVADQTGQQISLTSEDALVLNNGIPIELNSSLEGSNVFARFNPATYQLLEMESLNLSTGEDLISGVVDSFIPKFASGNITIRTIDGQIRTLTHHPDTLIRRNGLHVSIHDIRPGDLVRPNTKIRTSERIDEILYLNLKTPELKRTSGFIRGVIPVPDGQVKVTVSNVWFDLISLKINSVTQISQHGHYLEMQDLKVGQEIDIATYDPVSSETLSLFLNPPIKSGSVSR